MKNLFFTILLSVFAGTNLLAQDDSIAFIRSHAIYGQLGLGVSLSPSFGGFGSHWSLQYIHEDLNGFGIDLNAAQFDSQQLDLSPDPSQIINFDPTQNDIPNEVLVDGSTLDRFVFITVNYTRAFNVSKRIQLHLQAGPSIVFAEQRRYTYTYRGSAGSFGGFFFGGGGDYIWAKGRESTKTFGGAQLRINTLFKVSKRSVFSISPFVNVNGAQTVSGVQFGFVIGRGFKSRIFK